MLSRTHTHTLYNKSLTNEIVLQQSNLVDSTVTLHLPLIVRNKRWNSLQVEQEAERTKKMLANFSCGAPL